MKKNIKWIFFAIALVMFVVLCILVEFRNDTFIDSAVYKILSKGISDNMTSVIKIFTFFGSAVAVISITVLALIFIKNKKYPLFMALDLVIITLLQLILKNCFARNRPVDINLIEETGYSFPSGHSLTAFAFYGLIIYFIYTSNMSLKAKKIMITVLVLLILLVGISRIYLGVHFFTDVLGAFSFSTMYLIIYISTIKTKLN